MFSADASAALLTLANACVEHPDVEPSLLERWRTGARPRDATLDEEIAEAADIFAREMEAHVQPDVVPDDILPLFDGVGARIASVWCAASTWRREIALAPLL